MFIVSDFVDSHGIKNCITANTFSQIYIQTVFAVLAAEILFIEPKNFKEELYTYIAGVSAAIREAKTNCNKRCVRSCPHLQ